MFNSLKIIYYFRMFEYIGQNDTTELSYFFIRRFIGEGSTLTEIFKSKKGWERSEKLRF